MLPSDLSHPLVVRRQPPFVVEREATPPPAAASGLPGRRTRTLVPEDLQGLVNLLLRDQEEEEEGRRRRPVQGGVERPAAEEADAHVGRVRNHGAVVR